MPLANPRTVSALNLFSQTAAGMSLLRQTNLVMLGSHPSSDSSKILSFVETHLPEGFGQELLDTMKLPSNKSTDERIRRLHLNVEAAITRAGIDVDQFVETTSVDLLMRFDRGEIDARELESRAIDLYKIGKAFGGQSDRVAAEFFHYAYTRRAMLDLAARVAARIERG